MNTISILLADDHKIIREGLRALIRQQKNMAVVAEAEDGREAVNLAREHGPDVVIMDVAMPGLNGMEATRQILSDVPDTRIIALSMHSDQRFVAEMLKAGARGYLLKDSAFEEMVMAVKEVMAGKTYLSPTVAGMVVDDYVRRISVPAGTDTSIPRLPPREREVLQMIAEGKSTKEVAAELTISVKTVETFRRQIMNKLDIHNIAELTKFALREGLTSL